MKNVLRSLFLSAILMVIGATAFANDYVKFKGWRQAETTHFRFIYEAASEEAAKKYAEFADEAWEKIAKIYSMPQEKTNVYVFSRLNIVNAYTFFSPPEIVMYDSPVIESYFGFRDDWMKLFFTHELIHIANITFEDKEYLTSKLFGETIRGMDYSRIPGWALEGLTTVLETELSNGGRGRSPYFEMSFKAPTIDNGFIPYRLVGTEQEPPYSQIYVIGYLIMRSIADRWGLQALADIERNRTDNRSWEESVKFVTGHTPEDIYREMKISLEKRYAKERQIPEGKIISPNEMNSNYYEPAIILDDGSMITVREDFSDSYVVLLKPDKQEGMEYYEDNKSKRETILFKGAYDIAADENLNVYFSNFSSRYDRPPYNETSYPLFKWSTEKQERIQLTHDASSYYQPAVSRDGKVLVAVEQSGLKMRIVRIDTQTGEKTVMFQDNKYHFVQPALNADGSKIAFLVLKEDRACVALADTQTLQYKIVNNTAYDFITDPSAPSFNKDGTLTFCSNDRGRLEIYEAVPNSDGQTFTCTPMLSDPIGTLWAYKNDMGVFYGSQASTGSVIKIKPVTEWGNIPDFEGPSPAGQIMTFGDLIDDYPDFTPYTVEASTDEKDKPKHRSDSKIDELTKLKPKTKELTNETFFRPYITPMLYMPFVNFLNTADKNYLGLGGFFYGSLPRLQMNQGFLVMDAFYYPGIQNFTGEIILDIPNVFGTLDLFISRNQTSLFDINKNKELFNMSNSAIAGYTLPIIGREQYLKWNLLQFISFAGASFTQTKEEAFAVNEKLPFKNQLVFQAGLEYNQGINLKKDNLLRLDIVNLAIASYDFDRKKLFAGYEGEFSGTVKISGSQHEAAAVIRYSDFPSMSVPAMSRAHFSGIQENCLFPGKLLLTYTYTLPDILGGLGELNVKAQGLASFGKNTVDGKTPETGLPLNFNLEKKVNAAVELNFNMNGTQKLAIGYAGLVDLSKKTDDILKATKFTFYVNCKMNWLRF
ncbi:MAG: hypothetical protein K5907_07645 [Treponema sp.]|nr:hypothetical protein [Treponema sp.]